MNENGIFVVEADLVHTEHREGTYELLNAYALDSMEDSKPLSETARRDLVPGLLQHPTTVVFLVYRRTELVCRGLFRFAARPLLNISFTTPGHRGAGIQLICQHPLSATFSEGRASRNPRKQNRQSP